jgi:hypothetical protein
VNALVACHVLVFKFATNYSIKVTYGLINLGRVLCLVE